MSILKKTSLSFMTAGAVLLGLVAALLAFSQASAATGTVQIGAATVAPGQEGTVDLEVLGVGDPGLGAWTIDISYESAAVAAISCNPQQGVCNTDFATETVRFTGASANGLVGDTAIGSITFQCGDQQGSSVLGITLQVFADATLGAPRTIDATTQNGSIACVNVPTPPATQTPGETGPTPTSAAPTATQGAPAPTATPGGGKGFPKAGGGFGLDGGFGSGGGGTLGWLMAGLAGAGIAWLVAGLAGAGVAVVSSSGASGRPGAGRTQDSPGSAAAQPEAASRSVPRWLRMAPPPRLVKPDTFTPRTR